MNTSLLVESIFLIESDSHSTVQSGSVRITSQVVQSTAYKNPTDIDWLADTASKVSEPPTHPIILDEGMEESLICRQSNWVGIII